MKTWPKMLHRKRGSYEDEVALIRSDSCLWVIWGSVACKSPSCCYYNRYTLEHSRDSRGEEYGSMGKQGKHGHAEIFTYSQTDFLALSARERWCQIHSFLCRRENAMRWQWAQKQDKEEMFKFRPPSSTISSFTAMELWSCLVLWIPSAPPPPPPPCLSRAPSPHCVISIEGFSHSEQIPKEDQLVRPEFSQSLVFTDVPLEIISAFS